MKRNLIRIIAILLMLTLVVTSLGACQAPSEDGNGDYETPDTPSEGNESTDGGNEGDNGNGDTVDGSKKHALDGKTCFFENILAMKLKNRYIKLEKCDKKLENITYDQNPPTQAPCCYPVPT